MFPTIVTCSTLTIGQYFSYILIIREIYSSIQTNRKKLQVILLV